MYYDLHFTFPFRAPSWPSCRLARTLALTPQRDLPPLPRLPCVLRPLTSIGPPARYDLLAHRASPLGPHALRGLCARHGLPGRLGFLARRGPSDRPGLRGPELATLSVLEALAPVASPSFLTLPPATVVPTRVLRSTPRHPADVREPALPACHLASVPAVERVAHPSGHGVVRSPPTAPILLALLVGPRCFAARVPASRSTG